MNQDRQKIQTNLNSLYQSNERDCGISQKENENSQHQDQQQNEETSLNFKNLDSQDKQKFNDEHIDCDIMRTQVYSQMGDNRFLNQGLTLLIQASYELAIIEFDQQLELNSEESLPYALKGYCLYNLQKYSDAIVNFDKASQFGEIHLFDLNDFKDEALRKLEEQSQALNQQQELKCVRLFYVIETMVLKRKKNCIESLKLVYQKLHQSCESVQTLDQFQQAEDLSFQKNSKLAIQYYNILIAQDDENSEIFFNKGIALCQLERYQEALMSFNFALERLPDFRFYNNKAQTLIKVNKHNEAIFCFDQAIAIFPQCIMLYMNKGIALKLLNQCRESIFCLRLSAGQREEIEQVQLII